ncbi:hypothetical protein ACFWVU_04765 [Streptomyces sp. NPDC058686]|uniref:hypothetical protein n=1 Tax=Streptomyces sp. NPDC058686 TaxID=3346599 RepID=UPI00364D6157
MAWDEWEQLKAEALARRQGPMQLNSLAPAGGSGGGDVGTLKSNTSGKKAAVKVLQEDIRPGTDKAGGHADDSSGSTVREFSGWDTGSGLKDAHAEWELQVKGLKGRLSRDQTALEQTKQHFQYVDHEVKSRADRIDTGRAGRREV